MNLSTMNCQPCRAGTPPLDEGRIRDLLAGVPGWRIEDAHLVRDFTFRNYHETVAFVNAVAWIAHRQDHHPDIAFGFKTCRIRYTTHSAGGLSENDFICAARIDALL